MAPRIPPMGKSKRAPIIQRKNSHKERLFGRSINFDPSGDCSCPQGPHPASAGSIAIFLEWPTRSKAANRLLPSKSAHNRRKRSLASSKFASGYLTECFKRFHGNHLLGDSCETLILRDERLALKLCQSDVFGVEG